MARSTRISNFTLMLFVRSKHMLGSCLAADNLLHINHAGPASPQTHVPFHKFYLSLSGSIKPIRVPRRCEWPGLPVLRVHPTERIKCPIVVLSYAGRVGVVSGNMVDDGQKPNLSVCLQ